MASETMTLEEFDARLEASNAILRQELAEAQERVRQLEILIAQKEAFARKLDQFLAELERDEAEIAAMEKHLHVRRTSTRRRATTSV